jgi:hypothetical protein
MEKPILFISHSSKDKIPLTYLKELLESKTKGTVDIFLSSDGQSIPSGTNWQNELETALMKTSLMLVAISPNSILSNWVHFEAGYSYSNKKIRVIPIGIFGVDLSSLEGPINILQGFNISSYHSLNNIIEVLNKSYNTKFDQDFNDIEYNKFVQMSDEELFISNAFIQEKISTIQFSFGGRQIDGEYVDLISEDNILTPKIRTSS